MGKNIRRPHNPIDYEGQALALNHLTYKDWLYRLSRMALSIFEWVNLPESMNSEWLEWCLYKSGQAAFLYTKKYGFINTQATVRGKLNIYGKPIQLECYSYDFNVKRTVYNGLDDPSTNKEEECILVQNTPNCTPTYATLKLYAMRLTECMRAEDVNIQQQKTPYFIPANEKQMLTIQNAYQKMADNVPIIIGDKNTLDISEWTAVSTNAPYVADKLQVYRQEIYNEALNFLGINSVRMKRERLISDEAEENNEMTNLNLMCFLDPRKRACRYFNRKYGLEGTKDEIDVRVRSDLHNVVKELEGSFAEGNEVLRGIDGNIKSKPSENNTIKRNESFEAQKDIKKEVLTGDEIQNNLAKRRLRYV